MSDQFEDMLRLLEDERGREALSPKELDQVWSSLQGRTVPIAPPIDSPPAPAPSPPAALSSTVRAIFAGTAIASFGAGVLVGRATVPKDEPTLAPRMVEPMSAAPPPPTPSLVVPPVDTPSAILAPKVTPPPPKTSSTAPAPSAPDPESRLGDERALVEGARTALLRGRPSDALALAQKHERQFPQGGLAEDRDFLIVSALRDLGQSDATRAKAAQFLQRYPKSALRRTVEDMVNGR
jgi:hypothetical protein